MKKENLNKQLKVCHPELDSGSHINMTKTQRFRIRSGMTDVSGRSMVEMLGVLAIIGVLTIIGVAGFRYALNRHYANDLLHEVHRVAYSYSGHLLASGNGAAFDVNSVEPAAADASFSLKPYDDYFMVGVEGVDMAVCEQAAGTELPVSFQRRVYCDEGAMEFYFANDMGACDDAEKCALPEVCTEGQNQCGRLCCEQGETCMPGRCCPSGKYIAALNKCCEGDEIAYDTTGQGNYICKEPEEGDNCMDNGVPSQAKCNLSSDTKLYCKVTEFSGCNPKTAMCQELPSLTPQTFRIAGNDVGEFVKANDTALDWWSAKDLCESIGKELPTFASVCNSETNCKAQPTGRLWIDLANGIPYVDPWLEEDSSNACNARWLAGFGLGSRAKSQTYLMGVVCQPVGYAEPQPCNEGEVYNFTTDSCGTPCSSYVTCQQKFGEGYYCRRDTNTVDSQCTNEPTGLCAPLPTLTRQTFTIANNSVGEFVKANDDTLDWWSAKDLCESIGKELPTFASVCNSETNCKAQPTGRLWGNLANGIPYVDPWLEETDSCNARWLSGSGVVTKPKSQTYSMGVVCQPVGYAEPDPICSSGTYDISSDTCQ